MRSVPEMRSDVEFGSGKNTSCSLEAKGVCEIHFILYVYDVSNRKVVASRNSRSTLLTFIQCISYLRPGLLREPFIWSKQI